MARNGYLILDSDLHMMEPDDLWSRYLEGPHRANPPRFFGGQQRTLTTNTEDKGNADSIMGMEVAGLAIPAHGKAAAATASSRELRRRSRARHPHFQVARGRGFDPSGDRVRLGPDREVIFVDQRGTQKRIGRPTDLELLSKKKLFPNRLRHLASLDHILLPLDGKVLPLIDLATHPTTRFINEIV